MNHDEHVREVYAHFGLALYTAQVLEHAFVNAIVVGRLPQSARVTSSEIDDFMAEQFDAMLGKPKRAQATKTARARKTRRRAAATLPHEKLARASVLSGACC